MSGRNLVPGRRRDDGGRAHWEPTSSSGWHRGGANLRSSIIALTVFLCLCLLPGIVAPSVASAACSTADPAKDFPGEVSGASTDKQVEEKFTEARKAEGCEMPLVLPGGWDQMSPQRQYQWLLNAEREVRGVPKLELDTTLIGQIAQNHTREMAQYEYDEHSSPINQPANLFERFKLNPALPDCCGEEIGGGESVAGDLFGILYQNEDDKPPWAHRNGLLNSIWKWVGIGIGGPITMDFSEEEHYTPPATADTNPPIMAKISYSSGTATVTGVEDSPLNVNDKPPSPKTAAITGVVFYKNQIVEETEGHFNTVEAKKTAPGTWSAPIAALNPGEVLHAVAVDGSGNYTDESMKAPGAEGTWLGTAGHEGYDLAAWDGSSDVSDLPGVSLSLTQGSRYEWASSTSEARALQSPDGLTRRAAAYYDPSEVKLGLTFSKAFTGNLHVYALDWDTTARREVITVAGKATTLSSEFHGGTWVNVPVSVKAGETVPISATRTAGPNAVISGIFLGGAGKPPTMSVSSSPQGGWLSEAGKEGYDLAGWDGVQDVSYFPSASLSLEQGSRYQWAANTTDVRALESPDERTRNASAYYDPNQIKVKLTFAAAFNGPLKLYAVDWDGTSRREIITVNGQSAVLGEFHNGAWVSFPISVAAGGTVTITVDRTAGANAVLSGIFLGEASFAPTPEAKSNFEPQWEGTAGDKVGSEGYVLGGFDGSAGDVSDLPNASLSLVKGSRYDWAQDTSDERALQSPEGLTRNASTYYDPNQIQIKLSFTSAYTGNIHLYAVDWDGASRREIISVNGQSALIGQCATSEKECGEFHNGAWVEFPINVAAGGTVTITVDRTAGPNAVLSGIFLGGAGAPPARSVSTAPEGNWVGTFGKTGFDLLAFNGASDESSLTNASATIEQGSRFRWAASTGETRALENKAKTARAAAALYDANEVRLRLNFTAEYKGNIELYVLDWDTTERREMISVNGQTTVLSGPFNNGAWVSFPISVPAGGTVTITVDRLAGANALLSGVFLG